MSEYRPNSMGRCDICGKARGSVYAPRHDKCSKIRSQRSLEHTKAKNRISQKQRDHYDEKWGE